ncbi:MAG: CHAT domain-containing protein [Byssovorax sp.]
MIHHLGEVAESAGDPGRAKVLFEQALALRAGKLGPEHPTVADSYARLARLAAATGRPAEARWAAERAGAIRDRIAPEVLTIGSESQKRAYMTTLIRETDLVVGLSADHPDDPAIVRMALGTVLRRKGLVLEAMADIRATLRRRLGPAEQTIFDRLSALESQLASVSPAGGPVPGAAKLEAERRKLEAELSARSAPFREARRPVTVTEVASHLPEGAALLEIVRYKPYDPRHFVPAERWGPPRYGAYVLRPRGAPAFVALGDAEAIDTAVKRLRSALDDPSLAHDPKPAATAAYRQIFAPIVPQLGGAHTLWVSPDGELNLLPFAALIDPETDRLLLERYTFTYLTSGRDLVRSTEHVEPREAPLVVGAPAYDAIGADWAISTQAARDGDTRGRRSRSLGEHLPVPPLPATLPEALAAAALLPGARVLTGADATEAAIKAVRGPSVLHLATHGFFFEDERADARSAENALLRAGLLFAGANHLKSGEDDGVLTALEANALDLHGTSLVVLSACETGLGSASTGEGVYGLRRALSMAGAETVVMSLWRADDQVTLAVMVGYYQRLARGEGRSEAMRGAQLAMLGQAATAHPHLWASFIVSGRGDAMPSRRAARPTEVHGPPGCACAEARAVGGGTGALWIWSGLGIALLRRATKGRARAGRATS